MNPDITPDMNKRIHPSLWLAALLALTGAHAQEISNMDTSSQDIAVVQQLVDRHFEIWNDPDTRNWTAKFEQVYAPNFFVADYKAMANGYVEVGKLLQRVQGEHPGFQFHPQAATWNHGIGRVTWGYGPQDNPGLVQGEDIFTIKDGKFRSMHVFLNNK